MENSIKEAISTSLNYFYGIQLEDSDYTLIEDVMKNGYEKDDLINLIDENDFTPDQLVNIFSTFSYHLFNKTMSVFRSITILEDCDLNNNEIVEILKTNPIY